MKETLPRLDEAREKVENARDKMSEKVEEAREKVG